MARLTEEIINAIHDCITDSKGNSEKYIDCIEKSSFFTFVSYAEDYMEDCIKTRKLESPECEEQVLELFNSNKAYEWSQFVELLGLSSLYGNSTEKSSEIVKNTLNTISGSINLNNYVTMLRISINQLIKTIINLSKDKRDIDIAVFDQKAYVDESGNKILSDVDITNTKLNKYLVQHLKIISKIGEAVVLIGVPNKSEDFDQNFYVYYEMYRKMNELLLDNAISFKTVNEKDQPLMNQLHDQYYKVFQILATIYGSYVNNTMKL